MATWNEAENNEGAKQPAAACPKGLDAPEALLLALHKAQNILICPHDRPDGDALGSSLALAMALEKLGKHVTLADSDPVPPQYRSIPGTDRFLLPCDLVGMEFDTALSVDAARTNRLGGCESWYLAAPVQLQVDHHQTNTLFGHARWVDTHASASGCIVYRLIRALGVPVDADMGCYLYCAISTDTANFLSVGTTAEAFRIVAELMDAGTPVYDMARRLHLIKPEAQIRLMARAFASLRLFADGKCACVMLRPEDYAATGARMEHCFAVIDFIINVEGVVMAYMAYSTAEGIVHMSMRSRPPYDVSVIAEKMGGGGHVSAAGCAMAGAMENCCAAVEKEMIRQLEEKVERLSESA